MSFDKLCRSCMKEVDSCSSKHFDRTLLDMFVFCTHVQMSADDALPKYFCSPCTSQIESSYKFIKKAQEINAVYRNIIFETRDVKLETNIDKFKVELDDKCGATLEVDLNQDLQGKIDIDHLCVETRISEPVNARNDKETRRTSAKILNTEDSISVTDDFYSENETKLHEECQVVNEESFADKLQAPDVKSKLRGKVRKKYTSDNGEDDMENGNSCPICQKHFAPGMQKWLKRHIKKNHSHRINKHINKRQNERKACVKCQKTFKSEIWYTKHMQRVHPATPHYYQCPFCIKSFETVNQLIYHKDKQHIESKKHACNACGKRFKLRKQLVVHVQSHSSERPFVCDTCHMSFKMKHVLINHLVMHENTKRFLCSICGKSFSFECGLQEHMVVHTGERRFSCNECDYRALHKSTLRFHIAAIHAKLRPYKCSYCHKCFVRREGWARHVRVHTGERPFKCPQCPLGFIDTWKRKLHLMRFHHLALEEIPRLTRDGELSKR